MMTSETVSLLDKMESDEKQNKSDKKGEQGKKAQRDLQQDYQGQETQQDYLTGLADRILELGLQQDCQDQESQEPRLDHFFSGLADRNLDHVLTKIISYLSGDDIRSCLWTCRALRQAVMADKEALKKEDALFFFEPQMGTALYTRKVSDPFKMSPENIVSLTKKLGETTEREAKALLQEAVGKGTLKEPMPATSTITGTSALHLTFGLDYEDRVCSALGFDNKENWQFTPLENGDLVMVERKDDGQDGCKTTECWLVRVDDNGGKILDRWDHLNIVDEDDDLLKEISYGTAVNHGKSSRRGNKVLYIHQKSWRLSDKAYRELNKDDIDHSEPLIGFAWPQNRDRKEYTFALIVDLDMDKVLWKKRVGYEDYSPYDKPFIADKVCGFIMNFKVDGFSRPKRLVRFDIKTGAEILPDLSDGLLQAESVWRNIAPGRDVVALVSAITNHDSGPHLPASLSCADVPYTCQLLHARTGSPLRNMLLLPARHSVGTRSICVKRDYLVEGELMPTSVLFSDRILAMCVYRRDNERVSFAFWDLEEKTKRRVKYTWYLENKKVNACVLTARVLTLKGFETVAPSITGNIWFLLSSDWHEYTLHAVDINKSVTGFWELSQHSNSSVK